MAACVVGMMPHNCSMFRRFHKGQSGEDVREQRSSVRDGNGAVAESVRTRGDHESGIHVAEYLTAFPSREVPREPLRRALRTSRNRFDWAGGNQKGYDS